MNVILVATVTANGQLILTENMQKVNAPAEVLGVFVQKAKEAGNVVMGHATYNMVMQSPAMKEFFQE